MALAPGTRLGPYEILALIGAGGMGEVYRAADTRLGRTVAIKTLNGAHGERFQREARAIAALNHPHICALYDVGPGYLVMEFVDGSPLKGPMPPEKALSTAVQIAEALEAAHSKGIAHRDLKPANILMTSSGVKLLDFGLAKLATPEDSDATQTMAGTVMGTAAYMSPEQAQAKPADARSDIFSFGVVLYELLSGRRAFSADTAIATMAAILHKESAPLDAPPALQAIVARCLRKSPADRFQSAAELRAALESAAVSKPVAKQPSIAVLPFANMSRDADDEYFSDGLAEEIINALTQVRELKVIARTSAFAFKGKNEDIRKIADALGVSNILEGSVRRAGNRLRITAQLIQAEDGTHLWSQRYDRELTDVFAIQDEISAAIAGQLKVHLSGHKRATTNFAAYEALLEGWHHFYRTSPAAVIKALECFNRAISIDPNYALAHEAIAECYVLRAALGFAQPSKFLSLANASAVRALELDPNLAEAHAQIGTINAFEYDWAASERSFRRAVELNPAPSRHVRIPYAAWYLRPKGRLDEVITELDRISIQDPLSTMPRALKAQMILCLRRYDEAAELAQRIIGIEPDHSYPLWVLAAARARQHRIADALKVAEHAVTANGRFVTTLFTLAEVHAIAGHAEEAHRVRAELLDLRQRTYVPAGAIAEIHAQLGEKDAAFEWLQHAVNERDPRALLIKVTEAYDSLRSDPRYPALLRKMNLA
jgi:serine/threonine protein kinase/Tfp pilus assembly protein PilF